MRKAAKRKILSGAMALAMAASVLSYAPMQAYAETPVVGEQTQEEEEVPALADGAQGAADDSLDAAENSNENVGVDTDATGTANAADDADDGDAATAGTTAPEEEAPADAQPETPADVDAPADTADDAQLVTDWEWVTDNAEIAQNDTLNLTENVSGNNSEISTQMAPTAPASGYSLGSIIDQLPKQIKATDKDGNVITLDLSGWTSPEYEATYDSATDSYAQYGSYVFTATITNGTQLSPDAKKLQITVYLGEEPVSADGLVLDDAASNGLPNYGTRLVFELDPNNTTKYLTFALRVHYTDPNQMVVLERYDWNDTTNAYERSAANYCYNYWCYPTSMGSLGADAVFPQTYFSDILVGNGTGWQTFYFAINNDYEQFDPKRQVYVLYTGYIPVENRKDTSYNVRPAVAGGAIEYQLLDILPKISTTYQSESDVEFNETLEFYKNADTSNASNPLKLADGWNRMDGAAEWGSYPSCEGVINGNEPNKVETIKVKQVPRSEELTPKNVTLKNNKGEGLTYKLTDINPDTNNAWVYYDGSIPESINIVENNPKIDRLDDNLIIIRNDGGNENPSFEQDDTSNMLRIRVSITSPEVPINNTPQWSKWNDEIAFRAALYHYWSTPKYYGRISIRPDGTYCNADQDGNVKAIGGKRDSNGNLTGPVNTPWGTSRGETNYFETYLAPNTAVAIFPANTMYAFTYKVEVLNDRADNQIYKIDSVDGVANGAVWDEGSQTYQSGMISSYGGTNSVTKQEIVLHATKQGTKENGITFTKLQDQGASLRTLKVNLFDYTVPDFWHTLYKYEGDTPNANSSELDAQLRFISDSDNNVNDPAVNRINKNNRYAPFTGIVADKLSTITDDAGNTVYSLLPDFNYTTPFNSNLFDLNDEVKRAEKYNGLTLNGGASREWLAKGELTSTGNIRYKFAYPNVNFQFQYDDATGTYAYNSHTNHAQYDKTKNTVYLYDHALGIGGNYSDGGSRLSQWDNHDGTIDYTNYVTDTWGSQAAGFFPFDTYVNIKADGTVEGTGTGEKDRTTYGSRNPGFDANNNSYGYYYKPAVSNDGTTLLRAEQELNYHFGLSMEHQFTVPFDGQVKGQDMVFSFSGDDDMWLFVDGQLVLDLGGIHQSATGTINFTQGTYSINGVPHNLSDVLDTYTTANYAKTGAWAGGTDHSFQMFYLERGGTLSNLAVSFNLPDVEVQATKVWQDNDQPEKRQDVTLYLEQSTDGETWTRVADSNRTIAADAADAALTATWDMPMYNADGVKVTYRVQEEPADGFTSEVFVKNGEAWVSQNDDAYAAALALGKDFKVVNTIPKKEEPPKPNPDPKPSNNGTTPSTPKTTTTTTTTTTEVKQTTATTPKSAATTTTAKIPQTGDTFPFVGAVAGLLVGAVGIAAVYKKKKQEE